MKKIMLLVTTILLITSCGLDNNKVLDNEKISTKNEVNNNIENQLKISENKPNSILSKIPDDDIRNKTEYPVNFTGLQRMYFDDNKNIGVLLSYIGNMEYQGFLEKKEKEYAKIIVQMGEEFIKQIPNNKELDSYDKTISIPRLLKVIGNNYELLGENKKAIESYQKAIDINSSQYKIFIDLGNLYKSLGEEEKAQENFNKAKTFIKNTGIIKEINKSFEKFENNYGGYTDLGIIYKLLGENKKSKENFDKAEDIIKNNKEVYINEYENKKTLFNLNKIKFN